MRNIKLYIAISLNGKIAEPNGSVEWLNSIPNPENEDYGYSDFLNSVDTTIQGFKTYEQLLSWEIEFPYKSKKNYVFTRNQNIENTEYVEFVTKNHIEFIQNLKQQSGGDIWLIGGGQINTLFLNENLIDELYIFIMPIILTDGIELFENFPIQKKLKLIYSKKYSNVIEIKYVIENS